MLPKNRLRWAKLRRVLTSVPAADLLTTILVVAAIATIAAILIAGDTTLANASLIRIVLVAASVIGIILVWLLFVKTQLEYRRRTYDPTLIFELDKNFEKLKEDRSEAAKACKAFLDTPVQSRNWGAIPKGVREKVEPVLDFFEDLGFLLQGDQFSDEVVYHFFFHWIRGWYSNLESYVKYYREVENEMAAYEHIAPLHARTSKIEKRYEKAKVWLTTDEEKLAFLKEESEVLDD